MDHSSETPELFVGHDSYHSRDYLLSVYSDGTKTLATRPGSGERWLHWSAPVALIPESSEVTS